MVSVSAGSVRGRAPTHERSSPVPAARPYPRGQVWGLTPPSSGQPQASLSLPLMSNVRPFMRGALASERFGRIAGGAIQARQGRPRLPVLRRSAHRRLFAIEATSSTKAASSRVAAGAPPPGGAGRACASVGPLWVALLSSGSAMLAPSVHLRVAGNASWCGAVGPCGGQNTRFVIGRVCAQVVPLFARPNHSIERTSQRLRLCAAAHVERWAS